MAKQCGRGNKISVRDVENSNNISPIQVESPASPLQNIEQTLEKHCYVVMQGRGGWDDLKLRLLVKQLYLADQQVVASPACLHLQSDRQLKLDEVAVLDMCDDGGKVMQLYQSWRQKLRGRDILFVHSANTEPALYDLTQYVIGDRYSKAEWKVIGCSPFLIEYQNIPLRLRRSARVPLPRLAFHPDSIRQSNTSFQILPSSGHGFALLFQPQLESRRVLKTRRL